MKKVWAVLLFALMALPAVAADSAAFKLSLWDRAAFAIPGNINTVKGLELGIGSTADSIHGVQFDLLYAHSSREMKGLSHALVTMHQEVHGVQGGLLNHAQYTYGVQWGLINMTNQDVSGVQVGLYNQAESVKGVQFGLINDVRNIHGLQLGLVNIADNGVFPAMILVNGRF